MAATSWSGNFATTGNVTIPAGSDVVLNTNVDLDVLTINGKLSCAAQNLNVKARAILVMGSFTCGTPAAPFSKSLSVTLKGTASDSAVMGMGTKVFGAMGGGTITLAGEPRPGWTNLAVTANRLSKTITLAAAKPWRVGDHIVITTSDYHFDHSEERTITAVSSATLTLDAPLNYQHWCGSTTSGGKTIRECGEVGLLTRNIVIQGDTASVTSKFGGHMMVMAGSSAKVSGVEFLHMGQKGVLGRYPFHWHLVGDATGQYLDNSSIVHSYNRFLSIHGTHNTHVGGNVGYDTIGHGYYMEDGIEHGNVIESNLGALTRSAADEKPTPSDAAASLFWISNPDNIVRNNVAAGAEHTGFWLGFPQHPIGLSTAAGVNIWPSRTPLKDFSGNISHSNRMRGLFVDGGEDATRHTQTTWYEPRQNPADATSPIVPPYFKTFTAWKNREHGAWIRSHGKPVFQSPRLADNLLAAYFASLSGTLGYIQDGLVIGETANKGNADSWEPRGLDSRELPHPWSPGDSIRGLQFYDGPMFIRRTHFAGFASNSQRKAGALTNLAPNPFWSSAYNGSGELTFATGTNRMWLETPQSKNDGDAFAVIRDTDGSISGIAGRNIVPKNPLMVAASCSLRTEWNAYVCPYAYIGLEIVTKAGGEDLTGATITRDDGASRQLAPAPGHPDYIYTKLMAGRIHTLTLPVTPPKVMSFVRNENPGGVVRLSMAYPTANFTFKLWGVPVAKAASLTELASGGSKFFYDIAAKRLHMRLISDDGSWKDFELRRP